MNLVKSFERWKNGSHGVPAALFWIFFTINEWSFMIFLENRNYFPTIKSIWKDYAAIDLYIWYCKLAKSMDVLMSEKNLTTLWWSRKNVSVGYIQFPVNHRFKFLQVCVTIPKFTNQLDRFFASFETWKFRLTQWHEKKLYTSNHRSLALFRRVIVTTYHQNFVDKIRKGYRNYLQY